MTPGLIIAAPASGSGKTVVAAGVLRALRRRGLRVASFKVGPDYIDPAFHAAATGRDCLNLDAWGMRPQTLRALAARLADDAELVLGEGVMGLFDGTPEGSGSTADLAALTGWPVVLVVDVARQAASAGAVVRGFATHRPDVTLAGVVFNRVGGPSHAQTLRRASAPLEGVRVLGFVPRDARLNLPERHLGLVQAAEHEELEQFLDGAAEVMAGSIDLDAVAGLARPSVLGPGPRPAAPLPPLGSRIAIARDQAFAFCYPATAEGWRVAGTDLSFFSPLADEAPERGADAVYLPGGYPELHAGRLAANRRFVEGLRTAARRGAAVYGECGGYMVLGEGLTDEDGTRHPMAGLLPLETSFAERRLHLGYRRLKLSVTGPLGHRGGAFRGHEFHYASVVREGVLPLFHRHDAAGAALGSAGSVEGRVMGSFVHLIDRADP
ncbi:MAG: cobyrinate a,c-diamide synthase [Alphaproteobacteria bacterium]